MPSHRRHRTVLIALTALSGLLAGCSQGQPTPSEPSPSSPTTSASSPAAEPSGEPSASPSTGMRVTDTFFGMHDGRVSQGVITDAPIGALRLWDSGTSWLDIETSPGNYTWDAVDTAVSTSRSVGARPLLVLGQTPTFHASKPRQQAPYGAGAASMPDLGAWRRYVAAVADRYGNRIDYQVWNEANVVQYWAGTPRQMARLTEIAGTIIRREVPKATVVAPAFAMRLPSQQKYFEKFWAQQGHGIDLAGAVDVASANLYPQAEEPPEAQLALLDQARSVLAEQGLDLPLWNTEINYGLQGGPEPPTIPEERQRAYLMRTYLLNAGAGVPRVYWYSWNIGRIANTYLTQEDLTTETLAGRSYDTVRTWLDGARVQECAPTDGVWECEAMRQGQPVRFWWKPQGRPVTLPAKGAESWTDADGTVTQCRQKCRVRVGETPVIVVGP